MADIATLGIKVDSRGVVRATKDLSQLERQGQKTERVTAALKTAFAGLTAAISVREVANLADAYTNIENRLKTVTDNASQLVSVQEQLLRVSNETRTGLGSSVGLYTDLARSTQDLGISQDRLIRLTDIINKSFAASGTSAQEAAGAIRQLGQGLAAGALRGDEFNSVAEQAPEILRAVAAETGKNIGELREFAAEGGITSELLIRSLENYGDTVDKIFGESTATISQAFEVARNNAIKFIGGNGGISSAANSVAESIIGLSENIETLIDVFILGGSVVAARFAGPVVNSMASATAAQTAYTAAVLRGKVVTLDSTQAELQKAQAAQINAAAQLKKAQANQAATAAEVASWRAVVQSTKAEIELESIRLKSQITAPGRAASVQRLVAARLELAAATKALTAAEANNAATATAVATASNAAAATQSRLAAATTSAGIAARATAGALGLLRGALAFLGGPAGLILTVASAWYVFARSTDEATAAVTRFYTEASKQEAINSLQSQILKAKEEIDRIEETVSKNESVGGRAINNASIRLKEAKANLASLNAELTKLQNQKIEGSDLNVGGAITTPIITPTIAEPTAEAIETGSLWWDWFPDAAEETMIDTQAIMDEWAPRLFEEFPDEAEKATGEMTVFMEEFAKNTQNLLADNLFDFMQGEFDLTADGFKRMLDRMVAEAIAADLASKLFGSMSGVEGSSGSGLVGSLFSSIGGLFGGARAEGGPVSSGKTYLVGEKGPELFTPSGSGNITPNNKLASHSQTVNITQTFMLSAGADRRTQQQLAQEAYAGAMRAMRRNG